MKFKEIFSLKSQAFPWAVLGLIYLLLDIFVIGVARYEFPYGMAYAVSFLSIAFLLATKKADMVTGLIVGAVGVVVFIIQGAVIALSNSDIWIMMILSFLGLGVILLREMNVLKFKSKPQFKYMTLIPFFLMLSWAGIYFGGRLALLMQLPIATIVNHGGIGILSIYGLLSISGYKKEWLMYIGLLATAIGALWLTIGMGWGLQLTG